LEGEGGEGFDMRRKVRMRMEWFCRYGKVR
jgi:hypothetical protein